MSKYSKLIPILVDEIGGVDNVEAATHCVSRLRLVLKNYDNIDTNKIENLEHVKGVFKVNGQLHIIFGQEVNDVFKEFIEYEGMASKERTASEVKTFGAKKESFIKRMMNHLGEIFMPLIPILVAGGLILALRNILETKWVDGSDWSIVSIPFFKGLNDFLWIPACAVFWFLPVFIVWSIFKKMKGSQAIGILIGLSLLVSMPSTYDLNNAMNSGTSWSMISDFFKGELTDFQFSGWGSYPIKVGYTSQVIPAIGVAFLGVYTERWLNKKVTPVVRQVVVPLVTILFSYSMAMLVIGPVGFVIGSTISIIFSMAFTNEIGKYFAAPVFGFLYAPLVLTGLHHTLNAVMAQNTGTLGGSLIFPMLAISNIAQGASTLMYGIMNNKDTKTREVAYPATVSAWLGVTEPAMYGINLKYSFPFWAACIGSACGATLVTAAGVTSNGIGNGAWIGVINMQATSAINGVNTWAGTGFLWFIVSAALATAVAMVLTFVFAKTNIADKIKNTKFFIAINSKKQELKQKNEQKREQKAQQHINDIYSVTKGNTYSLDIINDEVFKNKILGDGLAIESKNGKVYSPIDGKISVVADTKHAYGITGNNGLSILIHIGVDTVKLEGKPFKPLVSEGDIVKKGQLICKFDNKQIIGANLENKIMVLVTPDSSKKIKNIFYNKNINKKDIIANVE